MVKAKQIRGKTAKRYYGAAMSEPEPLGLLDRATPKGSLSISVRQHWMALIRPPIIFSALLAGVFAWAAANPPAIIGFLHLSQAWPPVFLKLLQSFHDFSFFFVILLCMFAISSALWTFGQWQFTSFEIDHYGLTYRLGPFIQNTIPLRACVDGPLFARCGEKFFRVSFACVHVSGLLMQRLLLAKMVSADQEIQTIQRLLGAVASSGLSPSADRTIPVHLSSSLARPALARQTLSAPNFCQAASPFMANMPPA